MPPSIVVSHAWSVPVPGPVKQAMEVSLSTVQSSAMKGKDASAPYRTWMLAVLATAGTPKWRPKIRTRSPPMVLARLLPGPEMDKSSGFSYDRPGPEAPNVACCAPTPSSKVRLEPTPAGIEHTNCV